MKLLAPNKLLTSTEPLLKIFKIVKVNVKFNFEYMHLDTRSFV